MNQRFGFRLVWGENSIGIAIDEIFLTTPSLITNYYYWPQTDAWEQIRLDLETKIWIPKDEQRKILNTITEILNSWKKNTNPNNSIRYFKIVCKLAFHNLSNE